jgi:hypothetical protein
MNETCKTHGNMRNEYKIFVGRHEGKNTLAGHMYRCEDNVKVDLMKQ